MYNFCQVFNSVKHNDQETNNNIKHVQLKVKPSFCQKNVVPPGKRRLTHK